MVWNVGVQPPAAGAVRCGVVALVDRAVVRVVSARLMVLSAVVSNRDCQSIDARLHDRCPGLWVGSRLTGVRPAPVRRITRGVAPGENCLREFRIGTLCRG